jgi:hypothetical protein
MVGNLFSTPVRRGGGWVPPGGRLALSQSAYELHALAAGRRPAPDDLVLSHLTTPAQIDTIRFLRSHIDLSHSAGDPRFETDEKKETK